MSEDRELEHLKRKRLLEMQRHLLTEKAAKEQQKKEEEQKTRDPKSVLKLVFADSAWKVWKAAEQQYPEAAEEVAKALATLYDAGKLSGKIEDEQIYWLFMQLGLPVRLETKIRILESGELKSVADKLKGK